MNSQQPEIKLSSVNFDSLIGATTVVFSIHHLNDIDEQIQVYLAIPDQDLSGDDSDRRVLSAIDLARARLQERLNLLAANFGNAHSPPI